jgi:acyl carrier protein
MSAGPMTRAEIRARVTAIVCECGEIRADELDSAESFHRYGIDSLAGVNIAYEIGLLAARDVPSQLVTEHDTVDKLTDYVASLTLAPK